MVFGVRKSEDVPDVDRAQDWLADWFAELNIVLEMKNK